MAHPAAGATTAEREVDSRGLATKLAHLLVLLPSAFETDLESFDLAEPAAFRRLADPLVQVGDDLGKPLGLSRVRPQHRAAEAGVFVPARRAVGAGAGAEFELAAGEVLLELGPLLGGGFAVLLAGALGAAPVHERGVVAQHVVLVDRNVCLGGGQVAVTEQLRGDVHGQPAGDGLGGEDAPEVVRCIADRLTVGAAQVGTFDGTTE